MENRLYKRFKTGYKCKLECPIADKVKIKDVSIGGICLETSSQINTNNIYNMKIITKKNERIKLTGTVVRSTFSRVKIYNGDISLIYEIGLNFIKKNNSQELFLKKFTKRLAH